MSSCLPTPAESLKLLLCLEEPEDAIRSAVERLRGDLTLSELAELSRDEGSRALSVVVGLSATVRVAAASLLWKHRDRAAESIDALLREVDEARTQLQQPVHTRAAEAAQRLTLERLNQEAVALLNFSATEHARPTPVPRANSGRPPPPRALQVQRASARVTHREVRQTGSVTRAATSGDVKPSRVLFLVAALAIGAWLVRTPVDTQGETPEFVDPGTGLVVVGNPLASSFIVRVPAGAAAGESAVAGLAAAKGCTVLQMTPTEFLLTAKE